jgi:hypothetical protein
MHASIDLVVQGLREAHERRPQPRMGSGANHTYTYSYAPAIPPTASKEVRSPFLCALIPDLHIFQALASQVAMTLDTMAAKSAEAVNRTGDARLVQQPKVQGSSSRALVRSPGVKPSTKGGLKYMFMVCFVLHTPADSASYSPSSSSTRCIT